MAPAACGVAALSWLRHRAAFRVSAIRLRSLAQVAGSEKSSASNDLRHECSDSDCERRQKRSEDEPIGIADAVFVARHGQSSQAKHPLCLTKRSAIGWVPQLPICLGTFPAHNVRLPGLLRRTLESKQRPPSSTWPRASRTKRRAPRPLCPRASAQSQLYLRRHACCWSRTGAQL